MKLTPPTFSGNGDINMGDMMSAKFSDFVESGVDVVAMLNFVDSYLQTRVLDSVNDVAHWIIDFYSTPDRKNRTPNYQLPLDYCCAFRIYILLTHTNGLRTEDSEEFRFQHARDMIACEVKKLTGELLGPCGDLPIKKHDWVTVPKGTPYVKRGAEKMITCGKTHTVKVHYVTDGYYGRTVQNPIVVWAGTGGVWREVEMRYVKKTTNPAYSFA